MNMKLKIKMQMKTKKERGAVFFSTTGITAFPKYRRSSSFSFLQVPVVAKKRKQNKMKKGRQEEEKFFGFRQYLSSYKTVVQNYLEPKNFWTSVFQ